VFLGHFAIAFAAKRPGPRVSLGLLFAAAQLPDLFWPVMLLLGWEHVLIEPGATPVTPLAFVDYPWSHSLLMVTVWAVAVGLVLGRASRRRSWLMASLVLSHWILDWVTHRPDLPFWPGGTARAGLGLWSSVGATVGVELALFVLGMRWYMQTTRARDGIGRWGLVGLGLFLLSAYAANLAGPPPPSVVAVAWGTMALWLVVLWAWWVDHHRETAVSP
jgi:hypothetical protein